MMRSLFSGVSGLRVHQTKMDVIANNIANVNTIGYKSSRVTFNEVFYQRIQGASGPNAETGRAGTNPMQIGLGAGVASIDNIMTQGASQRTDNATDVMIQGNGFFIVSDGSGVYFTRAGNVAKDTANNLHINGLQLMGWDTAYNEVTGQWEIQSGPVKPISLAGDKQYVPPAPTSIINVMGNLNAQEDKVVSRTMEFYDSVGNMYSVDVKFTYHPNIDINEMMDVAVTPPTDPPTFNSVKRYDVVDSANQATTYKDYPVGTIIDKKNNNRAVGSLPVSDYDNSYWDFEFIGDGSGNVFAYPNGDKTNKQVIGIDLGDGTGVFNSKGMLRFSTEGELTGYAAYSGTFADATKTIADYNNEFKLGSPPQFALKVVPVSVLDPTARFGSEPYTTVNITGGAGATNEAGTIRLDFSEFRQYVGEHTNAKMLYANGNAPGSLEDISIGPDGKITGRYSNGQTKLLAQISVAKFQNPAGLEKVGNNLYAATVNSGAFDGAGEVGSILGGTLEMSNVDLSQEFTEMITTQRGFQANSRVITTSDDMLQELVNMKR